jgi:hypothetical protein
MTDQTTAPACPRPRKDGSPCKGTPTATGRCFTHSDPEAKRQAVTKGGATTAAKRQQAEALASMPMTTMAECRAAAEAVTQAMLSGRLDARKGQVAAALIRAAMTAIEGDLFAELEQLRANLAAQQPAGSRRRR